MSIAAPLILLAASDLDATLLGPDFRISTANRAAVQNLVEAGIRFILASGRHLQQMMVYYKELGFGGPIIACNGALVTEPGGQIISDIGLPIQMAADLINWAHTEEITALLHEREQISVTSRHHWNGDLERHVEDENLKLSFCSPADSQGKLLHKVVWAAPRERMDDLHASAHRQFGNHATVCRINHETVEFMPKGVDKASGCLAVADYYGFTLDQIMFFGDGNNDETALRTVGLGVAMHHGSEAAKGAARLIAPAGPPEDNFAAGVEAAMAYIEEHK